MSIFTSALIWLDRKLDTADTPMPKLLIAGSVRYWQVFAGTDRCWPTPYQQSSIDSVENNLTHFSVMADARPDGIDVCSQL